MNNNNLGKEQTQNDTIDLREIILKYLHKWYWFVLSVVCCIILAVFYIMRQNPEFSVSATLMLRSDNSLGGGTQLGVLSSLGVVGGDKLAEEELYIINSMSTMRRVI